MKLKNIKKVMAGTIAGALIVSATACTPISTKAEWSYRDGDNEKAIGVYIYALYNAYNQAKTFAEKADGYKENESFLDKKSFVLPVFLMKKAFVLFRFFSSFFDTREKHMSAARFDRCEKKSKSCLLALNLGDFCGQN